MPLRGRSFAPEAPRNVGHVGNVAKRRFTTVSRQDQDPRRALFAIHRLEPYPGDLVHGDVLNRPASLAVGNDSHHSH